MPLLETKEVVINDKAFILSKFPATVGREIIMQYPTSAMPKVGDYGTNEALMIKIMSYVGIDTGAAEPMTLKTRALIDNHIPDAETLMKLEWAMMNHNFAFFSNGSLSGILDQVATRCVALMSKILMDLSPALSQKPEKAEQP